MDDDVLLLAERLQRESLARSGLFELLRRLTVEKLRNDGKVGAEVPADIEAEISFAIKGPACGKSNFLALSEKLLDFAENVAIYVADEVSK